ncbi:DNA/RNA polymerase, partial [Schizophyllum commune Tattone D]
LPPIRAINHVIPIIDPEKRYPFRRSTCPAIFREQWNAKRDAYMKSGRWEFTTASNAVPMLLIPKNQREKTKLRTVVDLRARNDNTRKLSSPLPDQNAILRRVAAARYWSILDGKDHYEQIRVAPEYEDVNIMATPDGNVKSKVMLQG